MKELSAGAIAAIGGGSIIMSGSAKFVFGQTWRFWGGEGELTHAGEPYLGLGAAALIVLVGSERGGGAEGVELSLSGLDPDVAASIEAEDYHQKPATIRRMLFAEDRVTLLDAPVFMRGRVDTIEIVETTGGASVVRIKVTGPRGDMSRRGARIRSNADQRALGGATDGGMRKISVAGRRVLHWGRRPEVAGQALRGVTATPNTFSLIASSLQ